MKSLLQDEKECYLTKCTYGLDCHHIFGGNKYTRKKSEQYGMLVWLRHDVHMRLHQRDYSLELRLKQDAQRVFEEKYGHEKFMEVFRKNYL